MARQFEEDFDKDGGYEGNFGDSDSYVGDGYSDDFGFDDDAAAYAEDMPSFDEEREGAYLRDCGCAGAEDASDDSFDDPIRVYLVQMGSIPMLTREQERDAATEIESTRRRYRRAMLSFDAVIRDCVRLVGKIVSGRARLDRTVDVSVSDLDGKKHIQRILAPALCTLNGILSRNRADFKAIVSGKLSKEERAELRKGVSERRRRAARILNELNLRTQAIQPFFDALVKRQEQIQESLTRAREIRALRSLLKDGGSSQRP